MRLCKLQSAVASTRPLMPSTARPPAPPPPPSLRPAAACRLTFAKCLAMPAGEFSSRSSTRQMAMRRSSEDRDLS